MLARPAETEKLFIEGPVGRLEAILEVPADAAMHATAVVCHPHPQHEGTMHNKVAHMLARSFVQLGAATLRFNFRGVGESEGQFADAIGEVDDALAALDYMQSRWPGLPRWLGGFSFGAQVSLAAAGRREPDWLVSVAPPVGRMNLDAFKPPQCRWLLVQGGADELVDAEAVASWANALQPRPGFEWLEGVGHFFHGNLVALRETVVRHAPTTGETQ